MIWRIENAPAGEGKSGTHSALRWGQGRSVSPRKKQSCAAPLPPLLQPVGLGVGGAQVQGEYHHQDHAQQTRSKNAG